MLSERYGDDIRYKFDVPNGTYTARFYFAEEYNDRAGARLMDVSIVGASKLNDFDVFAEADGNYKGIEKVFEGIVVSDGQLINLEYALFESKEGQ